MPNGLTSHCEEEKEIRGFSVSKQPTPSLNPMLGVNHSCFHGNPVPLTILCAKSKRKKKKKGKSHM